jgi:serine protease inhibitor
MALGMTYIGARGRTAEQMATVLHLPADQDAVKTGFRQILDFLKVNGSHQSCYGNGKVWNYLQDLNIPFI